MDILDRIDTDLKKGKWAQHDYRAALRKFVVWLRNEYGYPEDHPEKEEMNRLLPILKYPNEVMKIVPSSLKLPPYLHLYRLILDMK